MLYQYHNLHLLLYSLVNRNRRQRFATTACRRYASKSSVNNICCLHTKRANPWTFNFHRMSLVKTILTTYSGENPHAGVYYHLRLTTPHGPVKSYKKNQISICFNSCFSIFFLISISSFSCSSHLKHFFLGINRVALGEKL